MTNREIARALISKNLGELGGRNDRLELHGRFAARLAGVAPGTPAENYLRVLARVWFDVETGEWHSTTPPSAQVRDEVAQSLAERVIWAVQEAVSSEPVAI